MFTFIRSGCSRSRGTRIGVEPEHGVFVPYVDTSTLEQIKVRVDEAPKAVWVDLIVGIRLSKAECLDLQERVVGRLQNAIIRAHEIEALAEAARPLRENIDEDPQHG